MAKLSRANFQDGTDSGLLTFHCPGCGYGHAFRVAPNPKHPSDPVWDWNGSMDNPTFSPSLLVNIRGESPSPRCHLFCRDGKLQFLGDCTHDLAGQTVEMPEEA